MDINLFVCMYVCDTFDNLGKVRTSENIMYILFYANLTVSVTCPCSPVVIALGLAVGHDVLSGWGSNLSPGVSTYHNELFQATS